MQLCLLKTEEEEEEDGPTTEGGGGGHRFADKSRLFLLSLTPQKE